MPLKFKLGDRVRQVVKPIEGVVTDALIVDGEVHFKVDFHSADGNHHMARTFNEDQIEAATPDPVMPE